MKPHVDPIQRAFELASAGTLKSIGELRKELRREGYGDHKIVGSYLIQQLRQLMDDANR